MKKWFSYFIGIVCLVLTLIILFVKDCAADSRKDAIDNVERVLGEYLETGKYCTFALRDIDQNGVPEVILGRNDGHPDGLCVAALVGSDLLLNEEIGSFGRIALHPGSQILTGVYGNHGCFFTYLFKLKQGKLYRSPIVLYEDAGRNDIHWYIDVSTGLARDDNSYNNLFNYELSNRAVELTEQEYSEIIETLLGEREVLACEEMITMTRDNIVRECQKWR